MKGLDYTALILTITGAINWGLVGLFKFDLVAFLFGNLSWLSRIIYYPGWIKRSVPLHLFQSSRRH